MPTYDEMRAFLREWYLHSRFEGRDGPVWGEDYSGLLVQARLDSLKAQGVAWIGPYESRTGKAIKFDAQFRILNADAPPPQIQKVAPSLGRIIHGQAW